MKRIQENGNSALLFALANRARSVPSPEVGTPSVNVMPVTQIGRPVAKRRVVVENKADWMGLFEDPESVEAIEVKSNCCNEEDLNEMDLRRFVNLKELIVGDECFENVEEVKLIGLNELEKVVIGMNSFTKKKSDNWPSSTNPKGHFYLKNCERLRELKIDRYSFSVYSVCEIESMPSLKVIEMEDLNGYSNSFYYASLELKSEYGRMN